MVTQQLIDYIKQQTAEGATPENIKKVLRINGWDDADVAQAMKSLGVKPIEASVASEPASAESAPQIKAPIKEAFRPAQAFSPSSSTSSSTPSTAMGHHTGKVQAGIREIRRENRPGEFSYIQRSSWKSNIFVGLLFVSATIVGLNLFFPVVPGSELTTPMTEEEAELARLVAGDPIVTNIVIDPNYVAPQVSLGAQESSLGGPKATYLKFKNEFDATKNYYELEALVLKYGSKTKVAQVQAGKEKAYSYPPELVENLFEKTKARTPTASQITTVQEGVSGNSASLIALTNQSGIQGNISMVLEGGLWKLVLESWKGYTATN